MPTNLWMRLWMLFVINNLSRIWWGTSRWDGGDGHWLPPWINLWPGENCDALHRKIWMNGLHWRRCKTCQWRETLWGMVTCPSHRKTTIRWNRYFISEVCQYLWNGFNLPIFRLRLGMTRTFRLCTCVKDFKCWSRKSVIYQLFVQSVKRLRLNFSLEKSSSEPFLYRFSLQLLSWYMNVPNLWTDSLVEFPWNCLNFCGILQVEYPVICC